MIPHAADARAGGSRHGITMGQTRPEVNNRYVPLGGWPRTHSRPCATQIVNRIDSGLPAHQAIRGGVRAVYCDSIPIGPIESMSPVPGEWGLAAGPGEAI